MARIPYADPSDLPEEYRYLLTETGIGDSPLIRTLANNPVVLQSYMRWGTTLWQDAGISGRQTELVILAVASELDAAFEWHSHVPPGLEAGLTEGEIRAVRNGDFERLDDTDKLLVRYAVAVARDGAVDEEVYNQLAAAFDEETVVGVTLLAGHYVMTARAIAALEIEVEGEFIGWDLANR